MNLFSLILYGLLNVAMVLYYVPGRGRFYNFPFWAGILSLGWFYPQAVGGCRNLEDFPGSAYSGAMLFAALCLLSLWVGYAVSVRPRPSKPCWLDAPYSERKLYYAGVFLCLFGFYFQAKLNALPEDMIRQTIWSGAAVKYLFLASTFVFGFLTVWLLYLSQPKRFVLRHLIFIIPCLMLLLNIAIVQGRRSGMMNLVAYTLVALWLVRRWTMPRWAMISGLVVGVILINGIAVYRGIMKDRDDPLDVRLKRALRTDFSQSSIKVLQESGAEFKNYVFYRYLIAEEHYYDYGLAHWNLLVFNYVPAQIVGQEFKNSLMLELHPDFEEAAKTKYGHVYTISTTSTGFLDAFASFGWLGFLKFYLIGWLMGVLYRHALTGVFLGQLLYISMLGTAMHVISHGSHRILFSAWVYFFLMGFSVLLWARVRPKRMEGLPLPVGSSEV